MKINLKNIWTLSLGIAAMLLVSCAKNKDQNEDKKSADKNVIFSKGAKITNNNFKGSAWLSMLAENDTIYNTQIGNVTFEPGARTNWHYHRGGQILLVTKGKGYYQEKGKHIVEIKKGDVIKCPPNVIHWHGAAVDDTLVHIAISTSTNKGSVVWLEPVSDSQYSDVKNN
ncbi:cupin domain-containing protein [Flavobacterium plurextorum]|uniref:cupin domain-containing protein n=1 Tax=Flavobacterium TaxID=237 RepID=UPI00214D59FC|nr:MULTISPECIES: cupin domain-containing protein [Flavobacterium]UUW08684.1 cupin domain-containing protein [Flavobacterium plurextorum]